MAKRIKKLAIKGKETVSNFIPFGANAKDIFLNNKITNNQRMNLEQVIPKIYDNINKYMQDVPFGFKYRFNYTLSSDGTPLVLDIIETTNHKENIIGEFVRENLQMNLPKDRIENFGLFQNKENKIQDFSLMFSNLPNLKYITELDTSHATNLSNLCYNSSNLISIPNLNVSKVERFDNMFFGCEKLEQAPEMEFYYNDKIPNIDGMFRNCYIISSLPNYNFRGVKRAKRVFENCYNLTKLPSSLGFNILMDASNMVHGCHNLKNVPNLYCNELTIGTYMFKNCYNLERINIVANALANGAQMFDNCLRLYDLGNFQATRVSDVANMFRNCKNLVSIPNHFGANRNITNTKQTFRNCTNLADVPAIYYRNNVTLYLENTYRDCPNLTTVSIEHIISSLPYVNKTAEQNNMIQWVGLSNEQIDSISEVAATAARDNGWNLPYTNIFRIDYSLQNGETNIVEVKEKYTKVDTTNYGKMVRDTFKELNLNNEITDLRISNMNRFTNIGNLFNNFTALTNLAINFNNTLIGAWGTFQNCYNLRYINNTTLSFNSNRVSIFEHTFENCYNLETINLGSNLRISYFNNAFQNCYLLRDITNEEVMHLSVVIDGRAAFDNCHSLDFSKIDFSNSTFGNMNYMFRNSNLKNINLPKAKIKNMIGTFESCYELTDIQLDYANIVATNLSNTFAGTGINNIPNNFYMNNVTNLFGTFRNCINLRDMPILNLESAVCLNQTFDKLDDWSLTNASIRNILISLPNFSQIQEHAYETSDYVFNNMSYLGFYNEKKVLRTLNLQERQELNSKGWESILRREYYMMNYQYINSSQMKPLSMLLDAVIGDMDGRELQRILQNPNVIEAQNVTNLEIGGEGINEIIDCSYLLNNYHNLRSFSIQGELPYNLISIKNLFTNKPYLTNISISNFTTKINKVKDFSYLYYNCKNIKLPFNMTFNSGINLTNMFYQCQKMNSIAMLNLSSALNVLNMFKYCNNLSDAAINNILISCASMNNVLDKSFINLGLNNTQINIAKNQPAYNTAINRGWGINSPFINLHTIENDIESFNQDNTWIISGQDPSYSPSTFLCPSYIKDAQNSFNGEMCIAVTNNLLKQLNNNMLNICVLYSTKETFDVINGYLNRQPYQYLLFSSLSGNPLLNESLCANGNWNFYSIQKEVQLGDNIIINCKLNTHGMPSVLDGYSDVRVFLKTR